MLHTSLSVLKLQRGFIACFTTYIDREINNSKDCNSKYMWHGNRTWTPNSLVFLESQYFYFNYRYYVSWEFKQGVQTETSKSSKKIKILHQLCNQTEVLLFLLIFYTTHTVTRDEER